MGFYKVASSSIDTFLYSEYISFSFDSPANTFFVFSVEVLVSFVPGVPFQFYLQELAFIAASLEQVYCGFYI